MNTWHHSVFSQPIPQLHPQGVDLISSSGATAVFILESAVTKGLQFNSVWSVGNAKQIGVEDVLQYMDENFQADKDSKIKLLYIESIGDPDRLLFHASSLIKKGCKIAAIKAAPRGSSGLSVHGAFQPAFSTPPQPQDRPAGGRNAQRASRRNRGWH